MAVSLPEQLSTRNKADIIPRFKHRIHIVRIYDGRHVELLGQVTDQAVNKD
jgi:hypothetical protein